MRNLLFVAAVLLMASPLRSTSAPASNVETVKRIESGIALFDQRYWSPTLMIWLDRPGDDLRAFYDGWSRPPWWPSANAVEVLIDFMNATGRRDFDEKIEALYASQKDRPSRSARVIAELKKRKQWTDTDERVFQARRKSATAAKPDPRGYYTDFQNEYLDDSGWWGVTWLKMYERTHAPKFLATARNIHAHMAANWRPDKGGGVIWCEDADKQEPNAITNNLFIILSARLYAETKEKPYLDWAEKAVAWIWEQKLYDGVALVDRPGHTGDYWSYNQGTFLGALASLYRATGRAEYLDQAVKVADTMLTTAGLARPDGVLVEKLGTGGDASLFKGIFARYLAQLRDTLIAAHAHPEMVQRIDAVLHASVASLLRFGIGEDGAFLAEWHEGASDRKASFNAELSGLAALVATLEKPPR